MCVCVYTFWCINLLSYNGLLWCLLSFFLKVFFVWYKNYYDPFLSVFIPVKYPYLSPHFEPLCILKLKWVSCRQHRVGSFFFFLSICVFLLVNPLYLHLDWVLICKSWLLPSEWLLSGCFLSPLIPFPFVSAYFCKLVAFHRGIVSPFYISCIYSRFLLWLPWSLH